MKNVLEKSINWVKKHMISIIMIIVVIVLLSFEGEKQEMVSSDRTYWKRNKGFFNNVVSAAECGITSYKAYNDDGTSYDVQIDASAQDGTKQNPYAIQNEHELINFSRELLYYNMNYLTTGKYFILTASEYDMQGDEKYIYPIMLGQPSGSYGPQRFMGTFIGNGATIKNVYIKNDAYLEDDTVGDVWIGLFAGIENGNIWDLNIKNMTLASEDYVKYNGGLAAYAKNSTFINCNIEYNADYSKISERIGNVDVCNGGLIGKTDGNINVINCKTTMGINNTKDNGEDNVFKMHSINDTSLNKNQNNEIYLKNNAITVKMTSNLEMSFSGEDEVYCKIVSDGTDIYMDTVCVKTTTGTIITVYDDGSYSFDITGVTNASVDVNNGQHTDATKRYCNVIVDPNYDNKDKFVTVVEHDKDTNAPNVERTGFKISSWSETKDSNDKKLFPFKAPGTMNMWLYWEVSLDYDELNAVKDITKDNAKTEDKKALNTAKDKLNEISNLNGLSQSDVTKIQIELDRINDALDKIVELEKAPTVEPTLEPTETPTDEPTVTPSVEPTDNKSDNDTSDSNDTEVKDVKNSSTGDNNNIVFWCGVALLSGIGLSCLVIRRKKAHSR